MSKSPAQSLSCKRCSARVTRFTHAFPQKMLTTESSFHSEKHSVESSAEECEPLTYQSLTF